MSYIYRGRHGSNLSIMTVKLAKKTGDREELPYRVKEGQNIYIVNLCDRYNWQRTGRIISRDREREREYVCVGACVCVYVQESK